MTRPAPPRDVVSRPPRGSNGLRDAVARPVPVDHLRAALGGRGRARRAGRRGPGLRGGRLLLRGRVRPHLHPRAPERHHEHHLVRHGRHPRMAGRRDQPHPAAVPHLRDRPPSPAPVGEGVRHSRRPLRRPSHLRGGCRPCGRGVRPHGPGVRPPGRSHRRGHRRPGRRLGPRVPRARRAAVAGGGDGATTAAGAVAPAAHLGGGDRRRPPSGVPPGSPTGGSRSPSAPIPSCWPRSTASGASTATALRSTSGASATSSASATRPVSSCPGERWPGRPNSWPSTCAPSPTPG